jgi:hypothetical protein
LLRRFYWRGIFNGGSNFVTLSGFLNNLGIGNSGALNTGVLNPRNTMEIGVNSGWFNTGSFLSGIFGLGRS